MDSDVEEMFHLKLYIEHNKLQVVDEDISEIIAIRKIEPRHEISNNLTF